MNLKPSLFCAAFCAFCFLFQSTAFAEMVAIKGNNVNMRSGPGHKHEVLWKMGDGFPLQVIKKSGDWLRVRDFEGSEGWVNKSVISKDAHAVVKANKGSDRNVNIRKEPNTKSQVVATAIYGVVFRVLARKDGWVQIQHENGVKGWIRQDLLWGI